MVLIPSFEMKYEKRKGKKVEEKMERGKEKRSANTPWYTHTRQSDDDSIQSSFSPPPSVQA